MKMISFIRDTMGLRPVEVEINITAGLPKIQFLGLPDTLIKESVLRIQSALKHLGYQLPKAKQVIVQLKPNYLKKSSQGLDLAVACGILWETGQEPKPDVQSIALYGELSLKGDVIVPDDFEDLIDLPQVNQFITGAKPPRQNFDLLSIEKLSDLSMPVFISGFKNSEQMQIRPPLPAYSITKKQAELLKIIAIGEHPTLLAGPPGTGKTTMAGLISVLLKNSDYETFKLSQIISRHFGIPISWRPIVSPHHTSTALAMIGGGSTPRPGEITRAHGGVLILDEFLEFDPSVQEALREPLETGHITVSRAGSVQIFPAKFLLLATTNLCPCGHLIPERKFECRGRVRYCHSSLQKLSGPMVDRFSILSLSHQWGHDGEVSVDQVQKEILEIQKFIFESRKQYKINHDLKNAEIEEDLDNFEKENLFFPQQSHRRYQALLKVARTIADCEFSEKIKIQHIEKARKLTQEPFEILKNFTMHY